ncbi:MAG: putative lipid II flippase FtsW [Myxococcota bacterium]
MSDRVKKLDDWLVISALLLGGLGLVMIYSASAMSAEKNFDDGEFYLKRQFLTYILGAVTMYLFSQVDYQHYRRFALPLLVVALFLLVLVLIPGIGYVAGKARRWIDLGFIRFQPAEIAKLALILHLSYALEKKDDEKLNSFTYGFIPHLIIVGIMAALMLAQPDFGSAITLVVILGFLLFIAGAKLGYLMAMGIVALPVVGYLILSNPERYERMTIFLDPFSDRFGAGYQLSESLITIGSGGLFGVGPGAGKQKLFFLPEAHTDFIFSIIAEELGFVGVIFVLTLILVIIARGIHIAHTAADEFGRYLAYGITFSFGMQAFVNIAMAMAMLPTKGLTLPLVSYGGTSMLITYAALGALLNIATGGENAVEKRRQGGANRQFAVSMRYKKRGRRG